jgi:transcriptional regulator with XRE-family HTH domain
LTGEQGRLTRLQRSVELEFGRPVGPLIAELLYVRRLTQQQVAKRLGVSQTTVSLWLRNHEREQATQQPEAAAV